MYLNKLNLMVVLLWIAIFPFYFPYTSILYIYQFLVALIIMFFTIHEIGKIHRGLFLFIYPLVIIISCIVNREAISYGHVARGGTNALIMIGIFLLVHKYIRIYGTEKLFKILYKMSKLYFFLTVIWIGILLITEKLEEAIEGEFLFLGGKFATAYMLIFYLMFFCTSWAGNKFFSKKSKGILFLFLTVFCMGICILIHSMTGFVAAALFLIAVCVPETILKLVNKPIVLSGLIIGSMVLIFFLSIILSSTLVQNLLTNILHKDLSLTGRMQLYALLYPLILKSGWWGSGFGSYVANQLGYHGWYNAQNGLTEIILTYGFIGAGAFLIMVFVASLNSCDCIKPLNAVILVFIAIAIVEIPFNLSFVFLLALLMFSNSESNGKALKYSNHIVFSLKRR